MSHIVFCDDSKLDPDTVLCRGGDLRAVMEALAELKRARTLFPLPFRSAHEGYAILLEEVDELWDEVKSKQGARDVEAMKKEAVQVAAMALKFIADVCRGGAGTAQA